MTHEQAQKRALDGFTEYCKTHEYGQPYFSKELYLSGYMAAWHDAQNEIQQLKYNCSELERVANEWMKDYDRLKAKYEPSEAVFAEQSLGAIESEAVPKGELWFVDKGEVAGKIINIGEKDGEL